MIKCKSPYFCALNTVEHGEEEMIYVCGEGVYRKSQQVLPGIVALKIKSTLPESDQRWPLKMVRYSFDPENPTKSCKSRGSNLWVHFKNTPETAQAIKCMHVQEATKYLKNATLKKQCVPLCCYSGRGGRPNSEAGHRVGGPKRVLSFCCTCLKMQRVMLNLRA